MTETLTVPATIYLQIEDDFGNVLDKNERTFCTDRIAASDASYRLASLPINRHIYEAIEAERRYQDHKYGTPAQRGLTVAQYLEIARGELDEAQASAAECNMDNALRELLQVVAVAVACFERYGVVER